MPSSSLLHLCLLAIVASSFFATSSASSHSHHRHHRRQHAEEMRGDGKYFHAANDLDTWRERHGQSPDAGAFGVDISIGLNSTTFECLVSHGFSFVVQRVWRSLCEPDTAAPASIDAAWQGGMSQVDVYLYPASQCKLTPEEQVQQAIASIEGHQFGTLWFDIETADSGWQDPATNLAWMQRAVTQAISQLGVYRVGVYTNLHNWGIVMANATDFGNLPVWYAHYDNATSFSDWNPFGAWQTPVAKQFMDGPDVCGEPMDHDWIPL